MKIVLEQSEFEKMAFAWVNEHLVNKEFYSASIVGDAIALEVFSDGDSPKKLESGTYQEEDSEPESELSSSFYDDPV